MPMTPLVVGVGVGGGGGWEVLPPPCPEPSHRFSRDNLPIVRDPNRFLLHAHMCEHYQ